MTKNENDETKEFTKDSIQMYERLLYHHQLISCKSSCSHRTTQTILE